MAVDPTTTKYLIRATLEAEGVVEKPDVIGAVFGQTEGLLGDELDLRDLQKSGRIGRIEVDVVSEKGRTEGTVLIPSSLDQVETSILAAALETIDRIGPCKAKIFVKAVEDVRVTKRDRVVERAKEILASMLQGAKAVGTDLKEEVRRAVQVSEVVGYGSEKLPAGPNVADTDAIIVVEGRSDVLNLLKCGIKNAVAVEGTDIPETIIDLSKEKVVTAFVDGDRGGDLILKELLQVAELDFVAKAPRGKEVEELTQKQIMKALRNKMPAEQFVDMFAIEAPRPPKAKPKKAEVAPPKPEEVRLSPELKAYRDDLKSLSGTTKARLFISKGSPKEVPVRDLAGVLKTEGKSVKAVLFDGVVTQRILDIASDNGVEYVIGMKTGNIVKQPTNVKVLTAEDLKVK
ncbi:MAG: DNA primase DnaG [Thermoplasmata archaeon]